MTSERNPSDATPVLGWFCTYTPEEIIVAAGLRGRRILGKTGGSARADAYLHTNLCAYVRACLNSALENGVGDLAGIIGVDSCDAMRRLFDVWRSDLSPGFSHMLALPHLRTPEAVRYYAAELNKLIGSLDEHFRLSISDEDLRHGIETVNETRSLLQKLSRLRCASSSMSGRRFYEILCEAMTAPKEEFNSRWRDRVETFDSSVPDNGFTFRVVLAGGVLDDPWVLGAIEGSGGRVVADDMCCGSRYFEELTPTDEEPLMAIAKRYIFRPPCARMSDTGARVERLVRLVEESGAHGLIYYTVKFCDPHMLDWVTLSHELQSRGIRALRCETDYSVNERERMRTRIEAFLEMLR